MDREKGGHLSFQRREESRRGRTYGLRVGEGERALHDALQGRDSPGGRQGVGRSRARTGRDGPRNL